MSPRGGEDNPLEHQASVAKLPPGKKLTRFKFNIGLNGDKNNTTSVR
jgi:hypothetical protein